MSVGHKKFILGPGLNNNVSKPNLSIKRASDIKTTLKVAFSLFFYGESMLPRLSQPNLMQSETNL